MKGRDSSALPAVKEVTHTIKQILKPGRKSYNYPRYADMYAEKLAPQLQELLKDVPKEQQLARREQFLQQAFCNETSEVRKALLRNILEEQVAEDTTYANQFQERDADVGYARWVIVLL
jgi:hypothetical protein